MEPVNRGARIFKILKGDNNSLSSIFLRLAATGASVYKICLGLQPSKRREYLIRVQSFLSYHESPKLADSRLEDSARAGKSERCSVTDAG